MLFLKKPKILTVSKPHLIGVTSANGNQSMNSPPKKESFAVVDQNTNYLQVNSRKCLVSGSKDKLIGLVGVNNLAVIDTPKALLICNIAYDDSYHVRDLVTSIATNPKLKHYFVDDEKK